MDLQSLIAYNLVLLAALARPGAAMLYEIPTHVRAGRLSGNVTGCGLAVAAARTSVWLAAGSTLAGFASLCVAESAAMWSLGLSVGLGTVASAAAALFLLPRLSGALRARAREVDAAA